MRSLDKRRTNCISKRRAAALLLIFALLVSILPVRPAEAAADNLPGISYEEFTQVKKNVIKPATLFIGTYMIELAGLTGTNYKDAMVSRETYKQDNKYYFTELDGGKWRDIVSAEDIKRILPGGADIPEEKLFPLRITCYIGADGVPKDPATMDDNNPFLLPDPYDLEKLPEFKTTWSVVGSGTDVSKIEKFGVAPLLVSRVKQALGTNDKPDKEILEEFFAQDQMPGLPIRDSLTNLMDKGVSDLWEPYKKYKADENGEEKATLLYDIMSRADATRRAAVFERVAADEGFSVDGTTLDALQKKLGSDEGSEEDYASLPAAEAAKVKTKLRDVHNELNEARKASKVTYATKAANKYVRGNTAIAQYGFDLKMELMDRAAQGESVIDEIVTSLINLKHIENDKPEDSASEYKMIDQILLPMQDKNIAMYLTEGAPSSYPIQGDSAGSKALLEAKQKGADNAVREIESYIVKMLSRNEDYAGQLTSLQRELDWTVEQKDRIKDDDFASYAEKVRSEYEAWLRSKIEEIQKKIDDGDEDDDDDDSDDDEIKELEKEKGYAERFDDPKRVKEIDEMLDRKTKERAAAEGGTGSTKKGTGEGGDPAKPDSYKGEFPDPRDGSGGNKALQESISPDYNGKRGGSGTNRDGSGTGNDSKGDGSGGAGNGSGNTGGTGGNGSGAGKDGTATGGTGNARSRGSTNDANKGSDNKKDSTKSSDKDKDRNTGANTNRNEADNGKKMSESELNDLLQGLFGSSFSALSPDAKGSVAAALNQYGREHNNQSLLELARKLLGDMMGEHNEFVYAKYRSDLNMEYVSLAAADRARATTRYRYVHEDLDATMSYLGGGTSYVFKVGSATMATRSGDEEMLSAPLVEQTDAYIRSSQTARYAYLDEADAQRTLNVRAEYMVDSEYAILVAASMEPTIKDVIAALDAFFASVQQ